MLTLDKRYQPPKSEFVRVMWDNGKFAFRFDPKRGLLELSDRGVTKVFDLAELANQATVIDGKVN